MGIGFFDVWFDSEYRQRRDINALEMEEAALADNFAAVSARASGLQRQVNELSLTVAVLVKILQEHDLVDPKVLHYRVEAEREAIAEAARDSARAAQAASLAAGAGPAKTPTPVFQVRCDGCGKTVASTHTTITERGTLCETCAP